MLVHMPSDDDPADRPPNGRPGLEHEWVPPTDHDALHATAPRSDPRRNTAARPVAPADIVERWATEGGLVRVATGIAPLDAACRGGLPVPWRVVIVGAPASGKTAVALVAADQLARDAGMAVGVLAVDEDPDDLVVRLAQMAGYTVRDAELREPDVMRMMADELRGLPIRIYDAAHTIESAAADLATWARSSGRRGALVVDSVQTARADIAGSSRSPRELVEASVAAIRMASTQHGLLVVATSEANRAAYRVADGADQADIASAAESRAIEYGAQTLLVLRTPRDHAEVIHVRVAKNRRAQRAEFWLRLDRERHAVRECADPGATDPDASDEQQRSRAIARIESDARELAAIIGRDPGRGDRGVRAAVQSSGLRWGRDRLDAAMHRLGEGIDGVRLEDRGAPRAHKWVVAHVAETHVREVAG